MTTDEIIEKLFKNPKFGLFGQTKMLQKIRNKINNQEAIQIFKDEFSRDVRKKFKKIDVKAPFISVQLDIADFPKLKSPKNNNVRYLLVAIDVYSRFIWVRTLTQRTAKHIEKALIEIFTDMKDKFKKVPKNITTDNPLLIS